MKKILLIVLLGVMIMPCSCAIKPRIASVEQGNIITYSEIKKLKLGMSKVQVQQILGEPVLTNGLDKDSWFYTYSKHTDDKLIMHKYLQLAFKNNALTKINGNY